MEKRAEVNWKKKKGGRANVNCEIEMKHYFCGKQIGRKLHSSFVSMIGGGGTPPCSSSFGRRQFKKDSLIWKSRVPVTDCLEVAVSLARCSPERATVSSLRACLCNTLKVGWKERQLLLRGLPTVIRLLSLNPCSRPFSPPIYTSVMATSLPLHSHGSHPFWLQSFFFESQP